MCFDHSIVDSDTPDFNTSRELYLKSSHLLRDVDCNIKSMKLLKMKTMSSFPQIQTNENHVFFSSDSDQWEVTLPPSISLLELFAQRSVYALTDGDDDRLSANCWLANPALEEPDAEPEVVKCDLLAWCKRYLPDLELEEELKKDTEDRQEDIVRPKRPRYRIHLGWGL